MKKSMMNNIVKIGDDKKIEKYEHCILMRMAPRIYDNNEKCIKIQVRASLLEFTNIIIQRFRFAGLQEIKRERKSIKAISKDGGGYTLSDAYEITLKKIPSLEIQREEE